MAATMQNGRVIREVGYIAVRASTGERIDSKVWDSEARVRAALRTGKLRWIANSDDYRIVEVELTPLKSVLPATMLGRPPAGAHARLRLKGDPTVVTCTVEDGQ